MGGTQSGDTSGTSSTSGTTSTLRDLQFKLDVANVTIATLKTQIATLNAVIANAKLTPTQVQNLTTLAASQVNIADLNKARSDVVALTAQVATLKSQLNAVSTSNEYVKITLKIQEMNTVMGLQIIEFAQMTDLGVEVLDELMVRNKILLAVKSALLKLYGVSSQNIATIAPSLVLPNEPIALTGSSLFFLYFVFGLLDSFYLPYKLFNI